MRPLEERYVMWLSWGVIVVSLGALFLHLLAQTLVGAVWDDAYMFVRYAHHVLSHGAVAWNGSEPMYGLTSLAQLIFTIPLFLFSSHPVFVAMGGSLLASILFFSSIPLLVRSVLHGASENIRRMSLSTTFALVASGAPLLGVLAASGMDTMLALFYVSFYLLLIFRQRGERSSRASLLLGVFGACAYLVRPDLMLLAILVPLALALWGSGEKERRAGWLMLMTTLLTLAVFLFVLFLYFKTPFPLPFYAKGALVHDSMLAERFLFLPILELIWFLDAHIYAALAYAAVALGGGWLLSKRGAHAPLIGVALFALFYVLYFLFFVVQVMGYDGRFYYPVLPALLVFSIVAIGWIFSRFEERSHGFLAIMICLFLLSTLFRPVMWGVQQLTHSLLRERSTIAALWGGNMADFYRVTDESRVWPCLDVFASLPKGSTLATTEVGMPGAFALDANIIDLAGLNSADIALGRVDVASAVIEGRADLVYLPSEHYYPELRAAMLSSAQFQRDYTYMDAGTLGSYADVGVRRESPVAKTLLACLQNMGEKEAGTGSEAQFYSLPLPYLLLRQL